VEDQPHLEAVVVLGDAAESLFQGVNHGAVVEGHGMVLTLLTPPLALALVYHVYLKTMSVVVVATITTNDQEPLIIVSLTRILGKQGQGRTSLNQSLTFLRTILQKICALMKLLQKGVRVFELL
jgi:hypothetical protein